MLDEILNYLFSGWRKYIVIPLAIIGVIFFINDFFLSSGSNSSSSNKPTQTVSVYKGNIDYKNGYEHGVKAKEKKHYDVDAYCAVMSEVSSLVPYPPTPAFRQGFNDGYYDEPNQY